MVRKLGVLCPTCQAWLSVGRDVYVPFVSRDLLCSRCGSMTRFVHPKYVKKDVSGFPTCLDCGHPIPPLTERIGRLLGPFLGLSRTCPPCWVLHRIDEPGDNLDAYINLWYRTDLRQRALANPPANTKMVPGVSAKPLMRKESLHASRKTASRRAHSE